MGALIAHVGAKWAVTWQALRSPSLLREEEVGRAAREPENLVDVAASTGLSRRGFLGTVAAASGVLTVTTVGQTLPVLRRLALLAPRDPASGPQGYPVNRGAANAGVVERAVTQDYRLAVLGGRVPVSLTVDELMALPAHEAELPIACVEGWSFSATWRGVRLRDVLALAGAPPGRTVRVESLEPAGAYRTSTLDHRQAIDDLTLLATHLDGQRLAIDHGYPCRLIAPDRPGVLQTKWVSQVVVL
jgi:DMSO/TMAO reductase YedYZ molybdopterin-dependent catalytic subunit